MTWMWMWKYQQLWEENHQISSTIPPFWEKLQGKNKVKIHSKISQQFLWSRQNRLQLEFLKPKKNRPDRSFIDRFKCNQGWEDQSTFLTKRSKIVSKKLIWKNSKISERRICRKRGNKLYLMMRILMNRSWIVKWKRWLRNKSLSVEILKVRKNRMRYLSKKSSKKILEKGKRKISKQNLTKLKIMKKIITKN